jgi:23S rRNA-/tRNA-specific pseudouridylate synthase
MVIDKPAGLPMHTTAKFWRTRWSRCCASSPDQQMEIAHRIDRETSGCC